MEKLPSGYKNMNVCLSYGNTYIDTGILPSSNTEVEIAMYPFTATMSGTTRNFIFGARDGTSNTSKGINLCKTYSNGYYFSYNTSNTLISSTKGDFAPIGGTVPPFSALSIFKLSNKIASLEESISFNALDESAVADFSCTHSMYLFGLNNNGNLLAASNNSAISYCKIWESGVLVRHYVACLEESSNYTGMYELVNGTFHQMLRLESPYYYYYWDIAPTVSGRGTVDGTIGMMQFGELIAIPENGYAFTRWEYNGTTLSNENPFLYDRKLLSDELGITGLGTFNPVAVFTKITDDIANLGYKMAVYSDVPTRYDISGGVIRYRYLQKGVLSVRSASIKIDGKQKATSSFVIDGDFNVSQGDYVYVYSQLGKNIFNGVVDSFDGNKIICGEMRYVYNKDALFHSNSSKTIEYNTGNGTATINYTNASISYILPYVYLRLLQNVSDSTYTGTSIQTPGTRYSNFYNNERINTVSCSLFANKTYGDTIKANYPLISNTSVTKLYDYLCDIFSEFGIYVESRVTPKKEVINGDLISCLNIVVYPKSASADVLNLGTNNEQISNINIKEESDTTTVLYIFNSAGTQCRGAYIVDSDGAIVPEPQSYNQIEVYVPKVVLSDDNINTVIQSNLSASKYNHMITFDVALDDAHYNLKFDDFKINQRIDFYYGNKVYRSVVTAVAFDIAENDDAIHKLKVTLGMSRSNLTSKLNLKKVKG